MKAETNNNPDKPSFSALGKAALIGGQQRREKAHVASDEKHDKVLRERFALLRTQLLREMRKREWRRLAVVPMTAGAGGTFVTVNLAQALARQIHTKVLLLDLNLISPGVADQLGLPGHGLISTTLEKGKSLTSMVAKVDDVPNLSVLATGSSELAPAELLQDISLADAIDQLSREFPADIVLMDMPPLLGEDAALAALPMADAILLVADGRSNTAADLAECERLLDGLPPIMGVILNKSED